MFTAGKHRSFRPNTGRNTDSFYSRTMNAPTQFLDVNDTVTTASEHPANVTQATYHHRETIVSGITQADIEQRDIAHTQVNTEDPDSYPRGISLSFVPDDATLNKYAPTIIVDFRVKTEFVDEAPHMTVAKLTHSMCYHFSACLSLFLMNARVPSQVAKEYAHDLAIAIVQNTDAIKIYRDFPVHTELDDVELQSTIIQAETHRELVKYYFTLHPTQSSLLRQVLLRADDELQSNSSLVIPHQ